MSINPVCKNAPLNEKFLSPPLDSKSYCFWLRTNETIMNTPNNDIIGTLTKCCQENFSGAENPLLTSGGQEFPDCYQYCLADSKLDGEPIRGLSNCLADALSHVEPNPKFACWHPDTKRNAATISGGYLSWPALGVVALSIGSITIL